MKIEMIAMHQNKRITRKETKKEPSIVFSPRIDNRSCGGTITNDSNNTFGISSDEKISKKSGSYNHEIIIQFPFYCDPVGCMLEAARRKVYNSKDNIKAYDR
jgi:hypothetical protein